MKTQILATIVLSACLASIAIPARAALVIYYPFDANASDAEPTAPNPTSTLVNNASINTTAGFARVGAGALSLDGADDSVSIASFDLGNTFTIAGFIRPTAAGSTIQSIFANSTGGTVSGFRFFINAFNTPGDLRLRAETGNGTSNASIASTGAVALGAYTHVAVTMDRPTGAVRLYINGVQDGSGTLQTNFATAGASRIGTFQDGTSFDFGGRIDDFRIYNNVLTQPEIAAIAVVPEPGSALLALGGGTALLGMLRRRRP